MPVKRYQAVDFPHFFRKRISIIHHPARPGLKYPKGNTSTEKIAMPL